MQALVEQLRDNARDRQAVLVEIEACEGAQPWKLNNTALKFFRDSNEHPPGFPTIPFLDLFEDDLQIDTLARDNGMDYAFGAPKQPWSWRKMLNAMKPDLRDRICGQVGVVGMWLVPLPGSYDHKRQHAARELHKPFPEGAPVPVWDFIVRHGDGKMFRFHPNQTNNKLSLQEMEGALDSFPTRPKNKGAGRSDGPGTYRSMLRQTHGEQVVAIEAKAEAKANAKAEPGAGPPPPPLAPPQPAVAVAKAKAEAEPGAGRLPLPPPPLLWTGGSRGHVAKAKAKAEAGAGPPPPPPTAPTRVVAVEETVQVRRSYHAAAPIPSSGDAYTEDEWDEWRAFRNSEWVAARADVAAAGGGGAAPAPAAPAPAGGGLPNQPPRHLTRPQCPPPREDSTRGGGGPSYSSGTWEKYK